MKQKTETEFAIPQETSWHFERTLKPDDKTIGNYVLIQPGASDIVKVLKAYFHHPIPGYNIASIEIIYNEQLNRIFFAQMKTMNGRKGNPKYTPTWKTETQGIEKQHRETNDQVLQKLGEGHSDSEVPNMTVLPLWHGTSEDVSEHIFNTGYGIFNTNNPQFVTDEGFFGRGVYTAHEAEYAFRGYAQKWGDKAVLLLNWVSLFEAYQVIHGDMPKVQGKPMGFDNCDAHFILVRSNQHPNTNLYYPCNFGEKHQYTEVVVFNPAQCLPRYRVKLLKNIPKPSIDDLATTNYQMGLDFFGLSQYAQVSNAFEDAHDAGHPAAIIRLNWLHSGASGVIPSNLNELAKYQTVSKEAIDSLKHKASFRGDNDHEAQFALAWCYQHGLGIEINLAKAAEYYWVAATQGHRDAQYQFGVCCSAGIGVQQNMKEAIHYYEKAALQNHVHAHYLLYQCYALGLGILPDIAKATLHLQAAKNGRHPSLGVQFMGAQPLTTPSLPTPIPCNHATEIANLKTTLAQRESELKQRSTELDQKQLELNKKDAENQQYIAEIRQLETALQVATDSELALKMEQQFKMQNRTPPLPAISTPLTLTPPPPPTPQFSSVFAQPPFSSSQTPPPPQTIAFSGVFAQTPSPSSSSPLTVNQKPLTYAEQVEVTSKSVQHQISQAGLAAFLKSVTEGNLVEAAYWLQKDSRFALGTETITDLSDRPFKKITGLQYATWAGDLEMFQLITKYTDVRHRAVQLKALEETPDVYSSYGGKYNGYPLMRNCIEYLHNFKQWAYEARLEYWIKKIGGEQQKCPAWLIYAWMEERENTAWTKQFLKEEDEVKRQYDKHLLKAWFTGQGGTKQGIGFSYAMVRNKAKFCTQIGGQEDKDALCSALELSANSAYLDAVRAHDFVRVHREKIEDLKKNIYAQCFQLDQNTPAPPGLFVH